MKLDTDVVVLGLGIHGASSAYELSTRGLSVIGIDQFPADHTRGSSHGQTRMIRRAYPNVVWNDFVDRAFAGWQRWSAASATTLVHTTGGLYAHPGESSLQGGRSYLVEDRDQNSELMPSFAVPTDYHAVYDPDAGVLEAGLALEFARDAAIAKGASLAFGEAVLRWEHTDEGCIVHTDRRVITTGQLVLAGGSWAGQLLPELAGLFEVWRIVTVTLRPGQAVATPPALGAFSVDRPNGLVFGIPDVGHNGFKVGIDAGPIWDPALPVAEPTTDEIRNICAVMRTYVPEVNTADSDIAEANACLYTMTADRRFVLGPLPWAPRVVVAAACSGHGFKFGPAVGEAVADWCSGKTRHDLDFIGVARRQHL